MGHVHEQAVAPAPAPRVEAPNPSSAGVSNAQNAAEVGAAPPVETPTLDAARHPEDPVDYRAALGWQAEAHGWMEQIVSRADEEAPADPADRRTLLRNTAQWIAAGEAKVTVLTRTHDAHLRPGVGRNEALWFQSKRGLGEGPGTYRSADDGVDDRAGLVARSRSARGGMEQKGTSLTVFGPTSRDDLEETLIHEVQHDADQHTEDEHGHAHFKEDRDKELPDGDVDRWKAGSWVYNRYRSEFRAYWMGEAVQGDPAGPPQNVRVAARHGPSAGSVPTSFKNQRQSAVFAYMYGKKPPEDRWLGADDAWWSRNPYAEFFHYYVFDGAFRKAVDELAAPAGGNLVNSVRVHALAEAIGSGDRSAMHAAASALDEADRKFLSDKKASAPFWEHVARHVRSFADLDDLLGYVEGSGGGSEGAKGEAAGGDGAERPAETPGTWTVKRGDTLGGIAAQVLGDAKRWPEIHRLNPDKVPDPNQLRRGTVLRLPEGAAPGR